MTHANKDELIRIARESGLPVSEDATVTDVVQLLGTLPILTDEIAEALNHILGNVRLVDNTARA
jgi:type III secretion system FlhB-like substrate exporter